MGVISAFGGVLDGHPKICGGNLATNEIKPVGLTKFRHVFSVSADCFTLKQDTFLHFFSKLAWVKNENQLKEPISGASFVKIKESLGWRLGGGSTGIPIRNSTEFLSGSDSKPGPDLPSRNIGFSSVKINDSTVMIIGGSGEMEKRTYFFDLTDQKWTRGPELNEVRSAAAAGVLRDHGTNEKMVAVVGGGRLRKEKSMEILSLDHQKPKWTLLENLPFGIFGHSVIEFGNDLIIIGGLRALENRDPLVSNDIILRLFCIHGSCHWETLPQRLQFPRTAAVAMKVPYDMFDA